MLMTADIKPNKEFLWIYIIDAQAMLNFAMDEMYWRALRERRLHLIFDLDETLVHKRDNTRLRRDANEVIGEALQSFNVSVLSLSPLDRIIDEVWKRNNLPKDVTTLISSPNLPSSSDAVAERFVYISTWSVWLLLKKMRSLSAILLYLTYV